MVNHLPVPQPRAAAHLGQDVGRVCHAFHAAGDHDAGVPQCDLIKGNHRRFHARAAHLVQCRGRHVLTQARLESRLPCRRLSLARRQNAAHQHLVHGVRSGPVHRGLDRVPPKIGGGQVGKNPLKSAHRRPRGTCYHDFFHFVPSPGNDHLLVRYRRYAFRHQGHLGDDHMKLSTRTEGQLQIISVMEDRIDAAVARAFKEAMRDMVEHAPPGVILDLGQVSFIDSSGLGAVVATLKLLPPGSKLSLAGLTPAVDRVFRLTRMDSVFSLFPTMDAAMAGPATA